MSLTGASADASLATALHAGCLCNLVGAPTSRRDRKQLRDRGWRCEHPHPPACDGTVEHETQRRVAIAGCMLSSSGIARELDLER